MVGSEVDSIADSHCKDDDGMGHRWIDPLERIEEF